jgi:SOS-response transcriptional repressor LexA
MTKRQAEALAFIAKYIEANGTPPSVADIMGEFSLKSKSGAARIVDALEEQGFIRRLKYRARSIQIIDPGEVKLNAEIFKLVQDYARKEDVKIETVVNVALSEWFGVPA